MLGRLRSFWDEPGPAGAPGRVWRDWALAGGFLLAVVVEVLVRSDLPFRWYAGAVAVAVIPTLLIRRTRPLLATGCAFGLCGLAPFAIGRDLGLNSFVFILFVGYALTRWGSGRQAVLGAAIITAKLLVAWLFGHSGPNDTLSGFGILFAVTALGAAVRYRARARHRELDQVKLLERERLARDLHDTVAHHVSAMIIRAQAGLATAPFNPDAATDALRVIEAEATRALTEMRSIVRVLRTDEPADRAPTPGLSDLHRLADPPHAAPPHATPGSPLDSASRAAPGWSLDSASRAAPGWSLDSASRAAPGWSLDSASRAAPHPPLDPVPRAAPHPSFDRPPHLGPLTSADACARSGSQTSANSSAHFDLSDVADLANLQGLADAPTGPDSPPVVVTHRPGPSVAVDITGDVDDLPAPIGTTLFRLAQESVTNARRHARNATRILVSVEADAAEVRLRVTDDGDPATTRPSAASGFGLIGMTERAGLVGGTCTAGPGPVQGWTVTAVLPRA
ncbi:histidine kinase [Dactylosporangium sp. NPDC051541]|uniref:ATP-binding protein n=1 Tax=Dactylosporangium sp. NPDC051541 TaxID=3363977 RepID=UPI003790979D